jgi:cytochrome c oxidase subunit 2
MYATTIVGIVYTVYALTVLTLMSLFSRAVTSEKKINLKFKISLTSWIIFVIVLALGFHVFTHIKFPWTRWQVLKKQILSKKEVAINVADYKFYLPEDPIKLKVNEPVKFTLFSQDVTYGFGIFRDDGTMVFQMQVLPGHANEIIWIFDKEGNYSIRSTEYSGPENWRMFLKDAVVVSE